MRRIVAFRIVAVSVASLACVLAAEFALRLLGHHERPSFDLSEVVRPVDDPVVDFRYRPHASQRAGGIDYRYNALGFRDVDHVVANPDGRRRIAIVGDSIIDGFGVAREDALPAQTARRAGADFEVIAIALSGLNTEQEVHLFEHEGLRFDPELVVLSFCLNDSGRGASYENALALAREQATRIQFLGLEVSLETKSFLQSIALVNATKRVVERFIRPMQGGASGDRLSRPWESAGGRTSVQRGLDRLAELRDAHGFRVLVLVWPVLRDFDDHPYREIHEWIDAQARDRDFAVLDLLPVLAWAGAASSFRVTANDVLHPNAVGHDLAAARLMRWLRENDLSTVY